MIRANISEIKNRLSYYLRLVRGGEVVEILDRDTPLARITHVSQSEMEAEDVSWIKEMERIGLVAPPRRSGFSPELLSGESVVPTAGKGETGVLQAMLEERMDGR